MPHQLTLLGPSRGAALRRGAVKANLIHHLAHAGGEAVLRRLAKTYVPPRDWVPASGRRAPPALVRAFDAALAVPTGKLTRAHPALRALDAFAAQGEFWAHVGLAFNLLRVWEGDAAFREALAHADAALALEAEWAWGWLLRGEIKRSLIDYAGGAEDLRRAAALAPEWSWAQGFLARALFQEGTSGEGLVPMDEAVRLGPGEGFLWCWRAEAYRRLGRCDEAARDFEKGLELDPSYDQGYGWRARLLDARGRHAEAVASLRQGLKLCPLFEKARRQLVKSLRGAGRTAEALKELERAADLNHRNDWLGVWRAEGQPDGAAARQALAELDAHLARRPRDARALAWKGETLAQAGRLPEALGVFDAALKRAPGSARARAFRGEALLRLGRVAEALADLDRAVRAAPDDGRALASDFVFPETTDFSAYKVLIVPALYISDDALLQRIADYVKNGGHVVMTFKSGFANENSAVRWERAPGPLREAAGFSYQEFSNLEHPLDLKGDPFHAGSANQVSYWAEFLMPEHARALAYYDHPFFGKWPAITENQFGSGTLLYEGTYLSNTLQTALLKQALQEAGLFGQDQQLPSAVHTQSGVNHLGKSLHYYFNYSGSEVQAVYAHGAGSNLLDGRSVSQGQTLTLGPWDLAIIEER